VQGSRCTRKGGVPQKKKKRRIKNLNNRKGCAKKGNIGRDPRVAIQGRKNVLKGVHKKEVEKKREKEAKTIHRQRSGKPLVLGPGKVFNHHSLVKKKVCEPKGEKTERSPGCEGGGGQGEEGCCHKKIERKNGGKEKRISRRTP